MNDISSLKASDKGCKSGWMAQGSTIEDDAGVATKTCQADNMD